MYVSSSSRSRVSFFYFIFMFHEIRMGLEKIVGKIIIVANCSLLNCIF
jgi:hypothetical protein